MYIPDERDVRDVLHLIHVKLSTRKLTLKLTLFTKLWRYYYFPVTVSQGKEISTFAVDKKNLRDELGVYNYSEPSL